MLKINGNLFRNFLVLCLPCSLKQLDCKVRQQSFIEEIKIVSVYIILQ